MAQTNQYDPEIEAAVSKIAAILAGRSTPEKVPVSPQSARLPVSGPPPRHPAMRKFNIIGIAPPEELAEKARIAREKKESEARRDRKRKPPQGRPVVRVDVTCPCGTVMHLAPWHAKVKKFCSKECRKRFGKRGKLAKYVFTPEMDEELCRVYREEVGISKKPVVRMLAEKFGVPAWKIKRRAYALGVVPISQKRTKESGWTELELELLKANASFSLERIQDKLRKAGYNRTRTAIKLKIVRWLGGKPKGENYTGRELERLFGLDGHCVELWIRKGFLAAGRRGTARTAAQHGDMWDIRPKDVRQFVIEHTELVDFRKLDKFWLVDLLSGKGM